MKWPGSLAAYRSPHCLFTGANGRVSVCPGQMAIFQFTGFTFIIYFFMSVLLLNEQELCGHNTFMAKNIGRLHQNLHDFRPPTPCPAFGCISRGIQRTELVRPSRARAIKALIPLFSDSDLPVPLHFFFFLKFTFTTAAAGASVFTIMSGHQRPPSLHAEKESETEEAQPASRLETAGSSWRHKDGGSWEIS